MVVNNVNRDKCGLMTLGSKVKYRFLSHTPPASELVSLGWGPSTCFLKIPK